MNMFIDRRLGEISPHCRGYASKFDGDAAKVFARKCAVEARVIRLELRHEKGFHPIQPPGDWCPDDDLDLFMPAQTADESFQEDD